MGRKNSGPAEDFMDLVAMLPWWAGVALAVFCYVLLHSLAKQPAIVAPANPAQIGDFASRSIMAWLAYFGQYFVPFLCLAGAFASFMRRKKRERLVDSTAAAPAADALHGMSWREFEMLVSEAFRLQGFDVQEGGGSAPDGGVDIELRRGRELFLVQCKQWKAYQVSVVVVREFYGVMAKWGAAGGFVVTSGTFTQDAQDFVAGTNLRLIDGKKLFGLLQQAKARGRVAPLTAATPQPASEPESAARPDCPVCNSPMARRVAKKGTSAGSSSGGAVDFQSAGERA